MRNVGIISSTANISYKRADKYKKLDDFRKSYQNIKEQIQQVEQFVKDEGILNCGEFTQLTVQLFTKYLNQLNEETRRDFFERYEIQNGHLDNGSTDNKNNHDHTFLLIVDKKSGKRVCVIDTWPITEYPHQIFIGTEDNFAELLKINVDDAYIKNNFTKEHIQKCGKYNDFTFKLTIDPTFRMS